MAQPTFDRVILIILDGLGVGELPDAADYGDRGSNTLGNIAGAIDGFSLPELERLGLARLAGIESTAPPRPGTAWGKMAELSKGKDSTTGHWEIAGLVSETPFPLYPDGFPPEVMEPFRRAIGRDILGNLPASGTEIIEELGPQHQAGGKPIIYTSADSVFQVAAHEAVIPIAELYHICRTAREILTGPHAVARVIARPFIGEPGRYSRTRRRRDFSLEPTGPTVLDSLIEGGLEVVGIGKVDDLFGNRGLTAAVHTESNRDGMEKIIQTLGRIENGLIFTNLIDFDMLWGHRNDYIGFYNGLTDFDRFLPELIGNLGRDDLMIITADHGNDPTTPSTDHSREYVPLLVYGQAVDGAGIDLGVRETFADIGATIARIFNLEPPPAGDSFLSDLSVRVK